jgi:hypothetical protein
MMNYNVEKALEKFKTEMLEVTCMHQLWGAIKQYYATCFMQSFNSETFYVHGCELEVKISDDKETITIEYSGHTTENRVIKLHGTEVINVKLDLIQVRDLCKANKEDDSSEYISSCTFYLFDMLHNGYMRTK